MPIPALGLWLAGLVLLSAVGWARLARRSAAPIARARPVLAIGGLVTIVIALASPLDDLAHARFSAHMLQHMLLTTVAAPALLLADPCAALLWALPRPVRLAIGRRLAAGAAIRRMGAFLVRPPVAWILSTVMLWLWHAPAVYDRALGNDLLHALEHLALFASGVLLWWPVIEPAPRLRAPSPYGVRIVYLVLAAFQGAALGLLLALSPGVLYTAYAAAADALEDQARGGILLWAFGGVVDMGAALRLLWIFLGRGEAAGPRAIDHTEPVRENEAV